jgi:hypothetical protein
MVGEKLRRVRLEAAGIAAIVMLVCGLPLARADEAVADPRKYCDQVAKLVSDRDLDELTDSVVAHAKGMMSDAEFKAAASALPAVWERAGRFRSVEHVSELNIGESYARHWYALIYDHGPLFIRCTMYRVDGRWYILGFSGNSAPERIGLGK